MWNKGISIQTNRNLRGDHGNRFWNPPLTLLDQAPLVEQKRQSLSSVHWSRNLLAKNWVGGLKSEIQCRLTLVLKNKNQITRLSIFVQGFTIRSFVFGCFLDENKIPEIRHNWHETTMSATNSILTFVTS